MKDSEQENYLFSNPICKQTYKSLPKIYGGNKQKSKHKIILNSSIAKHQCNLHNEIRAKQSPLNKKYLQAKSKYLSLPRGQKCSKKNCMCNLVHQQNLKTLRKIQNSISPKLKIKLKPLIIAKPDDFQSQHKVAMRVCTQPNLPSGLAMIVNSQKKIAILRQSDPRLINQMQRNQLSDTNNEQQIQTKRNAQNYPRSKTQQVGVGAESNPVILSPNISFQQSNLSGISKKVACVQVQVNLDDAIEKRSEQQSHRQIFPSGIATQTPEINQSSVRQKIDNSRFKKISKSRKSKFYASDDQDNEDNTDQNQQKNKKQNLRSSRNSTSSLAISKCHFKGINSKTTEFKKLGQKQQKQNLKASRAKSTNSNGTFRIPSQKQYISYLKSYRVLDKNNFNLKELVKKPLFSIVEEDDGVYFGEYEDNNKTGTGINVTQKAIFEGVYEKNIKIKGCERNIDGFYKGYFVNGKRQGYGTFEWNNGQKFEGNWKDGVKCGFGIWKSPKGDSYQGQWANNRQHGEGTFKHKNSIYKGQFQNFLKHGKGQQQFLNGDNYTGSYKFGKPDGFGKYTWYEGGYYEGQFKNGIRSGNGKLFQSNGSHYEGQFLQDFKHGKGKQTYKTGQYFQGNFVKGNPIKGMLYKKQGKPQYIDNQ